MKWSRDDLEEHIKICLDSQYGSAVIVSAFYKKIFKEFPNIYMSGAQKEAAEYLLDRIKEVLENRH